MIMPFISKCSTFFGGIPSGHSVLETPLSLSVISLILTGCITLKKRHPLKIDGGLDKTSSFVNPSKNTCGSAKMMYNLTDFDSACGVLGNLKTVSGESSSKGKSGELTRSIITQLDSSMGKSACRSCIGLIAMLL